jgi:outer membrane protein assembly factor BamB
MLLARTLIIFTIITILTACGTPATTNTSTSANTNATVEVDDLTPTISNMEDEPTSAVIQEPLIDTTTVPAEMPMFFPLTAVVSTTIEGELTSIPSIHDDKIYFALRSGYVFALNAETLDEEWMYEADTNIPFDWVHIGKELGYFSDQDGLVTALRLDTGEPAWTYESAFEVLNVQNGVVFARKSEGLVALNATDGSELWSYAGEISPVIADDTAVYFADNKAVVSLNLKTGEKKWQYEMPFPWNEKNPLYIEGETLIIGDRGGFEMVATGGSVGSVNLPSTLFALNTANGEVRWSRENLTVPVVVENVVYGQFDGKLYAIDVESGEEIWNIRIDGVEYVANRELIVTTKRDSIRGFDSKTGEELWELSGVEPKERLKPLYISEELVYFSDFFGSLYAADIGTGTIMGIFNPEGNVITNPPVIHNGTLYFEYSSYPSRERYLFRVQ